MCLQRRWNWRCKYKIESQLKWMENCEYSVVLDESLRACKRFYLTIESGIDPSSRSQRFHRGCEHFLGTKLWILACILLTATTPKQVHSQIFFCDRRVSRLLGSSCGCAACLIVRARSGRDVISFGVLSFLSRIGDMRSRIGWESIRKCSQGQKDF